MVASNADADDFQNLCAAMTLMIDLLDTVTTAVTRSFIGELRSAATESPAARAFTSALLRGDGPAMARAQGFKAAERYAVLAADHHMLRRVRGELADRFDDTTPSLVDVDGGTILVPNAVRHDKDLDDLVERLANAAGADVLATVTDARPTEIPDAVTHVSELLTLVRQLGHTRGLYRLDDIAMEYQLARHGPGRPGLDVIVERLDPYPDLLATVSPVWTPATRPTCGA